MQKLTAVASLVLAALLLTSCGDTEVGVMATGPTTVVQPASFGAAPTTVFAQPVLNPFCPAVPPFRGLLNLSVRAGTLRLFINEIRLQFVDITGTRMPQITLPAPVMTTQFGSALVEARQTRVFPLSFGLGCLTGRQGTMTVIVITRDQNGVPGSGQISVFVR
jgi:hypothetical protein